MSTKSRGSPLCRCGGVGYMLSYRTSPSASLRRTKCPYCATSLTKVSTNAVCELKIRDKKITNPHEYHDDGISTEAYSRKVFLVHGHNHDRIQAVARFLEHISLEPIILNELANLSDTVIEKLERYGKASYAVALLTPDDLGRAAKSRHEIHPRARQNVWLELGYFIGRLGRERTCALIDQGVEVPSDYSGVIYIPMGTGTEWKILLTRELRAAGLPADMEAAV